MGIFGKVLTGGGRRTEYRVAALAYSMAVRPRAERAWQWLTPVTQRREEKLAGEKI
ncbi:hypothetical protein [Streptomyces fagopyri]